MATPDAMTPRLSVVIPTRDRCRVLRATLQALETQHGVAGAFEVVVVDDGSRDETPSLLTALQSEAFPLQRISTPARGPAAARNRGVALARGERVLLLGDDTIPLPTTLAAHLDDPVSRQIGIQGRIDWHPDVGVTDVMRFLAPEGPQFYFRGLETGRPIPYSAVLASNMSAPTRWFREEPFDEAFPWACVEDTELAYRWSRRGWQVVFDEQALCLHHHRYDSIEPFLARQQRAGRATRMAVSRHPRLLWPLICHPVLFSVVVTARMVARAVTGRRRVSDRWELAWRWRLLRGFLGSHDR